MLFWSLPCTPLHVFTIALLSANILFSMLCFLHKNEYVYKIAYLLLSWSQTYLKSALHTIVHKIFSLSLLPRTPESLVTTLLENWWYWSWVQLHLLEAQWPGVLEHCISKLYPCWKQTYQSGLWVCCWRLSLQFYKGYLLIVILSFHLQLLHPHGWVLNRNVCTKYNSWLLPKRKSPSSPSLEHIFSLLFCQPFLLFFKLLITQLKWRIFFSYLSKPGGSQYAPVSKLTLCSFPRVSAWFGGDKGGALVLYLMDGIESAWISAGCLDTGLWSVTGAPYWMPLSPLPGDKW